MVQESQDGTRKFLWALADGERLESVLMPRGARRTLCISSQAGCALGCVFCATGVDGLSPGNLKPWEIAAQVREIVLRDPADKPTNVVFMGMGEPLLNWDAVDATLTILNSPDGFGIGARHITVSTVGIVPGMHALSKRPEQFRLAISLHSPHAADRLALMPVEKKYSLKQVIEAAQAFHRRITFEYVLIADRNDREKDVVALGSLARKLGAHVNLLPLHPGGNPDLVPSSGARIREFRDELANRGIEAVVRRSRGLDIDAACGQLFVEDGAEETGSRARIIGAGSGRAERRLQLRDCGRRVGHLDDQLGKPLVDKLDHDGLLRIVHVPENELPVLVERARRENSRNVRPGNPDTMPPAARDVRVSPSAADVRNRNLETAPQRPELVEPLNLERYDTATDRDLDHGSLPEWKTIGERTRRELRADEVLPARCHVELVTPILRPRRFVRRRVERMLTAERRHLDSPGVNPGDGEIFLEPLRHGEALAQCWGLHPIRARRSSP